MNDEPEPQAEEVEPTPAQIALAEALAEYFDVSLPS
jgi:hypothetical protein